MAISVTHLERGDIPPRLDDICQPIKCPGRPGRTNNGDAGEEIIYYIIVSLQRVKAFELAL